MTRDDVIRRAGPQVPDPLFATQIPAGLRLSCSLAQLPPVGQPDPTPLWEFGYRPLRCVHYPDDAGVPLLMDAHGDGLGVPAVSQRGIAGAGEPTVLPVRLPGAHLHPQLRRRPAASLRDDAGSGG